MSKKQTADSAVATATATLDFAQTKAVLRAITNITGCGDLEAKQRFAKLSPDDAAKVAQLELGGRRKEAVTIIYQ